MSTAQTPRTGPSQRESRAEARSRNIREESPEDGQPRLAYTQPPIRDTGEAEGAGLAALAELLQTYPGLLDGEVGGVARALAQATVAASKVAMQGGSGSMGSLEKIRLGRALANATAARGMSGGSDAGGRAAAAGSGEPEAQGEAGGGLKRRWFTQAHLRRLQSEGVVFRKGKFTEEENAEIDGAVAAFVETHGLTQQEMYAHLFQRKAHDAGHAGDDAGRQVRRAFWPELAEALPERPLQAIYHHVRRKFHPHNYQGAWTAGEDARLQRLVAAHGPAWEAISQEMGRMGTNCRDRWRYIQNARARQNVRPPSGASNDDAAAEAGVAAPT